MHYRVKTREQTRLENEYNKANRESAEAHSAYQRSVRDLNDKRERRKSVSPCPLRSTILTCIPELEKEIHQAANALGDLEKEVTLEKAIADATAEITYHQE